MLRKPVFTDIPESPHIEEVECSAREAYIKWKPGSANNSPLEGFKLEVKTNLDDGDDWQEIKNDIDGDDDTTRVRTLY